MSWKKQEYQKGYKAGKKAGREGGLLSDFGKLIADVVVPPTTRGRGFNDGYDRGSRQRKKVF